MTALSGPSNPPQLSIINNVGAYPFPVAASTSIYAGALCCIDASGDVVNGSETTGLTAIGVATNSVDNSTGLAGAATAQVSPGVFKFKNSAAGDAITGAERGDPCYIVDNQTVAKTSASGTRSIAGTVILADTVYVWVAVGFSFLVDAGDLGGLSNATPQAVGTAAAGTGTLSSRDDHVHAHGNQLGGTLHADVVAGVSAGFMTAAMATSLAANVAQLALLPARIQSGVNTLTAGTSGNITAVISANTRIVISRKTAAGTTDATVEYTAIGADRTVGATGPFIIKAVLADGTINTADASIVDWIAVG